MKRHKEDQTPKNGRLCNCKLANLEKEYKDKESIIYIKDNNCQVLMKIEDIKSRWNNYYYFVNETNSQ